MRQMQIFSTLGKKPVDGALDPRMNNAAGKLESFGSVPVSDSDPLSNGNISMADYLNGRGSRVQVPDLSSSSQRGEPRGVFSRLPFEGTTVSQSDSDTTTQNADGSTTERTESTVRTDNSDGSASEHTVGQERTTNADGSTTTREWQSTKQTNADGTVEEEHTSSESTTGGDSSATPDTSGSRDGGVDRSAGSTGGNTGSSGNSTGGNSSTTTRGQGGDDSSDEIHYSGHKQDPLNPAPPIDLVMLSPLPITAHPVDLSVRPTSGGSGPVTNPNPEAPTIEEDAIRPDISVRFTMPAPGDESGSKGHPLREVSMKNPRMGDPRVSNYPFSPANDSDRDEEVPERIIRGGGPVD